MMKELLKMVLSLSLSGSLLILALLAARPLVKGRLSSRWRYYIWLVVVARLLLPIAPPESPVGELFRQGISRPSPDSTVALPQPEEATPPDVRIDAAPANPAGEPAGEVSQPAAAAPAEKGALSPRPDAAWLLLILWAGVAAVLLVRKVTAYQGFVAYLRAGWEPVADVRLLDRLAELSARAGGRGPVELCVNPLVSSPMLVGLFRPAIVLPTAQLPEEDFGYTVLHELTHHKSRDLLYKWLVQLTVCLHWFNPLVWRMAREVDRACELCCDETVIRRLDSESRREYGDTLLRALGAGGRCPTAPVSVMLHESGALLKERLAAITGFRERGRMAAVLSLLLAVVVGAGAVTAGAYTGPAKAAEVRFPPAGVKGDSSAGYRYTQKEYFQAPYLFEVGWNVNESAWERYPGRELTLPEGGAAAVFFGEDCQDRMDDEAVLQALAPLLARLEAEEGFPLTRALVLGVREAGETVPDRLAEELYQENSISGFSAAFATLEREAQRQYLMRCYEDSRLALLASCLNQMPAGDPVVDALAERAYQDSAISFFSVAVNHMTPAEQEGWIARAARDKRSACLSVLLNTTGRYQEKERLEEELEARQAEEYAAWGVSQAGWRYYYQDQLVRILMDQKPSSSFNTLAVTPEGTVDIKILRDAAGEITGVAYMTAEEVAELDLDLLDQAGADPDDWDWDPDDSDDRQEPLVYSKEREEGTAPAPGRSTVTVPVDLAAAAAGAYVWLGDYDIVPGDSLRYDVTAEAGEVLQVGLAREGDVPPSASYCMVQTPRQDGLLQVKGQFTVSDMVPAGRYRLFVRGPEGALGGVRGSVVLSLAQPPQKGSGQEAAVTRVTAGELPAAVQEALKGAEIRRWYLIVSGGRQYLRDKGFAYSYGYAPARQGDGWRIEITRFQREEYGDLLLEIPGEGPVSVTCDGEPVADITVIQA